MTEESLLQMWANFPMLFKAILNLHEIKYAIRNIQSTSTWLSQYGPISASTTKSVCVVQLVLYKASISLQTDWLWCASLIFSRPIYVNGTQVIISQVERGYPRDLLLNSDGGSNTGAELPQNTEASAELTTATGGTFTSSSARPSNQSRYSMLNQWLTCFHVTGYWNWQS